MNIIDLLKKRFFEDSTKELLSGETVTGKCVTEGEKDVNVTVNVEKEKNDERIAEIAPKNIGKLDMVIAFDTTGSMSQYIGAVRKEVSDLIPQLFRENEDLRLGIVAFGDYWDMKNAQDFGDAYQVMPLTNNENNLIKFVENSRDTGGGDGPEFYELVLKKIVEETPWRDGSTRSILLIADAVPHEIGYSFENYIHNNQIDWRVEGRKAADKKIKIDTVTITDEPWFKELSRMTDGVSIPFRTGYKTADLVRASAMARGSMKARLCFDKLIGDIEESNDEEMKQVYRSYKKERDSFNPIDD